jgi:hypothetical protein
MHIDVRRVRITEAGRLELEAWAEVDAQANHCRQAMLDLESGEILSCKDVAWAIP